MMFLLVMPQRGFSQCDPDATFTWTAAGSGCSFITFTPVHANIGTHTWDFGGVCMITGAGGTTIPTTACLNTTGTYGNPTYLFPLNTVGWSVVHTYIPPGGFPVSCTQQLPYICFTSPCPGPSGAIRYSGSNCTYSFDLAVSGATIVSWDYGDGTIATGNVNPGTHTYAASGVFTITVTYTLSGVTYTCTVDVMVYCGCITTSFTSSVSYTPCNGLNASFKADCDDPFYVHQWNFGDGCVISGFSGTPVINPGGACNTTGTYDNPTHYYNVNTYTGQNASVNVSHTLLPVGTPITTTTTLNLLSSLPAAPGIYIGYAGFETTLSGLIAGSVMPPGTPAGTPSLSGQDLYIHGSLVVNVTYRFDDCNLRMAGGAALEVRDNRTLRIWTNSEVTASECGCLWRWIRTAGGSTTDVRQSILRDALFTFYPVESSSLNLRENLLQNNFIGIFYDEQNVASLADNFNFTAFRANIIETTGTLLPVCNIENEITSRSLLPTTSYSTAIGFSGMFFKNTLNQNIPEYTAAINNNTLRNLANGIRVQDGDLNIRSCLFENILDNTTYGGAGGYGVFFITGVAGNTLRQRGISHFSGQTTYLNCSTAMYRGTFVPETDVQSWDNIIDYNLPNMNFTGYTMVAVANGSFENLMPGLLPEIFGNTIHINTAGIQLFNQGSSNDSEFYIHENTINNEPQGGSCISADGNNLAVNDIDIMFNDIHMHNCQDGISFTSWKDDQALDVFDNTISLDGVENNFSRAVKVDGSSNITFSCNHIFGNYATGNGDSSYGFFLTGSTSCEYHQNDIHFNRTGMWVDLDCSSSDIAKNTFEGPMNNGMEYSGNVMTTTGVQLDKGNVWTGAFNSWGALHNSMNSLLILGSRYSMATPLPTWNTSAPSTLWFDAFGSPNATDYCSFQQMMSFSQPESFGDYESSIANGEIGELLLSETELRVTKESVYRRILQNSGMDFPADLSPDLTNFEDQMSNQPIGQFYSIGETFSEMEDAAKAPYLDQIAELNSTIATLRAQLNEVDSIYALEIEDYYFDKTPLLSELSESVNTLRDIYQQVAASVMNSLCQLSEINESVASQNVIDENESRMNRIYFSYLMSVGAEYNDADWVFIETLAHACPNDAGNKVYLAKAIYSAVTGDFPESPCTAEDRATSQGSLQWSNSKDQVSIYPNPFTGNFKLTYPKQDETDKVTYEIAKLTGEIFKEEALSNAGGTININGGNIPQGVYIITLKVNSITISSKKIIKI